MGEVFSMISDLFSAFDHKNWRQILMVAVIVAVIIFVIALLVSGSN